MKSRNRSIRWKGDFQDDSFSSPGQGAALWALRRNLTRQGVDAVTDSAIPHDVVIAEFSAQGKNEGMKTVEAVVKTDAEWKALLTRDSYEMTRRAGTEYPYSGKYWNLHDNGLYRCICCDTAHGHFLHALCRAFGTCLR